MGIASYDVTGDGYPDYYLTSQGDNKLQTLANGPAQPTYEDIALEMGATATRPYGGDTTLPSTAWHSEFADVNNDGYIDLFVAKGNVEAMPDYAAHDPSNLLIGQSDGTFVEGAEAAGIVDYDRARGAALADLNLDGQLDLVVVYRREPARLWRNVGAGNADGAGARWATGSRSTSPSPDRTATRSARGSRSGSATARIRREVTVGGGHLGGQLGLGALRAGRRRARRTSACSGPTARQGRGRPWPPTSSCSSTAKRARPTPWLPGSELPAP